jgi:phosphatidylinositol alpha-1,6-mannosyltransferase
MQRVAQDLFHALGARSDIELTTVVLRTTWADTHRKVVPFLLRAYRAIKQKAEEESVDVILFSSMVTASLSVPLRKRLNQAGIRTAAIVHGLDVTTSFWLYQRFVPRVFDSLDAVLPISRATRDACLERGLDRHKAFIVPNGIDIARFEETPRQETTPDRSVLPSSRTRNSEDRIQDPAPRERETFRRLCSSVVADPDIILKENTLLLTSVGRQVKRKGFEWFVSEVMPLLPDNVHYWLAGEGPEQQRIRSAIARHKLEDRVQLLGRVSDELLQALYRGGDLFIMPNIPVDGDMEGFGVVLLEAALSGQPAIAAGIEGILDVVSPGENGILVESGDSEGFARAIESFNADRSKLAQLSRRTREHTIKTFSWQSVAEQYVLTLRALATPAD